MHASIDQLLRLRDEPAADEAAARHVDHCAHCHAQLEQLRAVTRGLRSLPDRWTPPDRFDAIRDAFVRPRAPVTRPRARPGWLLPAASAALVVIAVLVTLNRESVQQAPTGETVAASGEIAATVAAGNATGDAGEPVPEQRLALIHESQRLQELLDTLPTRPGIVRASTALTVADLEDRIEWVDYRLTNRNVVGLDAQQAERLWRERVELLNSLVAVRYAEAYAPSF